MTAFGDEPLSLRATVLAVAAVQVAMAAFEFTRGSSVTLVIGFLLLLSAAGLVRRVRWGRRMTLAFMWLLVAFAVGDVLPARIEADEALGRPSATTGELVTQLVVLCVVALASLHFLARHKDRYRPAWW